MFQYGESDQRVWTTRQLGLILHTDTILKRIRSVTVPVGGGDIKVSMFQYGITEAFNVMLGVGVYAELEIGVYE